MTQDNPSPCKDCLVKPRCRDRLIRDTTYNTMCDMDVPFSISTLDYALYKAHIKLSKSCLYLKCYMYGLPCIYYGTVCESTLKNIIPIIVNSFNLHRNIETYTYE